MMTPIFDALFVACCGLVCLKYPTRKSNQLKLARRLNPQRLGGTSVTSSHPHLFSSRDFFLFVVSEG